MHRIFFHNIATWKNNMDTANDKIQVSRSVVLVGYGGLEKLQIQNVSFSPVPQDNEVYLEVKFCGLNFADIYTRQGLVQNDSGPPFTMGLECSGVVLSVGSKVESFKKGDRVIAHTGKPGLQTEYLCVDASSCFMIPDGMTLEEAAAFPVNYLTAYFCLFDLGNLRSFQTVLIPSAAGGVGWAATQLARTVSGVKVVGLASPTKHDAIIKNGVDIALNSSNPHWDEEVKSVCPNGIDLALEFSSGENFKRTLNLIGDLGRVIIVGANSMITGDTLSLWRMIIGWWCSSSIKPIDLVLNSKAVAGFHLNHVKTRQPERYREAFLHLLKLNQAGMIRPRIDSIWTFDQIIEATKQISTRKNIGKVILSP